tara:strand:+ start:1110 stop:2234 length:1125 start_codon:yes stop_codon:yes gene_type:complete
MNNSKKTSLEEEVQVDIIALIFKVWTGRKFVIIPAVIGSIFGVLVAIYTPNTYTASSMFIPNASSSIGGSSLRGLASLAGIDISSGMKDTKEISPMLYGKILESYTFKKAFLESPINNLGETTSLKSYFKEKPSSNSLLSTLKEYTIELPSKIIELIKSLFKPKNNKSNLEPSVVGLNFITKEDFIYFKMIENMLKLDINEKYGYLEIEVKSNEAELSAQMVKNAVDILQREIIAIKTKSSLELLSYLEEQYVDKKNLLTVAQDKLAKFKDSNLNISKSSYTNTKIRLEAELQVVTSVYQNVVTQLEQVKLQVAKDTPVFSFLKPVIVPNERSAPNRKLIVFLWLFFGASLGVIYLLAKDEVIDFIKNIIKNQS